MSQVIDNVIKILFEKKTKTQATLGNAFPQTDRQSDIYS